MSSGLRDDDVLELFCCNALGERRTNDEDAPLKEARCIHAEAREARAGESTQKAQQLDELQCGWYRRVGRQIVEARGEVSDPKRRPMKVVVKSRSDVKTKR